MAGEKSEDAYRTIGEVAEELDLPQHVLRFWETRFGQLRPMKRAGGRRFYRPVDVALLKGLRRLLYEDGYTIKGVRRILRERGPRYVAALGGAADLDARAFEASGTGPGDGDARPETAAAPEGRAIVGPPREALEAALSELVACKRILDETR